MLVECFTICVYHLHVQFRSEEGHYVWINLSVFLFTSFNERVGLIVEHEQGSSRERAQTMASEERELADLFRRAEMDYEARLSTQVWPTLS